jgi:hypothetical protein
LTVGFGPKNRTGGRQGRPRSLFSVTVVVHCHRAVTAAACESVTAGQARELKGWLGFTVFCHTGSTVGPAAPGSVIGRCCHHCESVRDCPAGQDTLDFNVTIYCNGGAAGGLTLRLLRRRQLRMIGQQRMGRRPGGCLIFRSNGPGWRHRRSLR